MKILPACDGTEDGIIPLSDILLSSLGWAVDDRIEITVLDNGTLQLSKFEHDAES